MDPLTQPGSWNPLPRIVKVWAEGETFKVMMEGSFCRTYGSPKAVQVTVGVEFTEEGNLQWTAPTAGFWVDDFKNGGLWRHPRRIGKFAVAMGYPNPECLLKSFKEDPRPIYLASYQPPPTLWEHLEEEEPDYRVCPDTD